MEDARGREEDFDIDKNGFMWRQLKTTLDDLKDRDSIETKYFREIETFLMALLGPEVRKIKVFDWKVGGALLVITSKLVYLEFL